MPFPQVMILTPWLQNMNFFYSSVQTVVMCCCLLIPPEHLNKFNVECLNNFTCLDNPLRKRDSILSLQLHKISWNCCKSQICALINATTQKH